MNHNIHIRAVKKATKSSCRYKVVAIGFNKSGRVLGMSFNHPRFDRLNGSVHAEMNLIRKYGNQVKTIWIGRVGGTGAFLRIDPCESCLRVADKLGIKIVNHNLVE